MKEQFSNNKFVNNISPGLGMIHKKNTERNLAIFCGALAIFVAGIVVYNLIKENNDLNKAIPELKKRNNLLKERIVDLQKKAGGPVIIGNNLANPIIQGDESKPEYHI